MKKSRMLACLLALALLAGLLPLSAMAEGTFGWRYVQYDSEDRPYCNPENRLQTEINLEPGISHHMGFFLDDALCQPSDIWVEDESVAAVSTLEEGSGAYYRVEALAFGETILHVTVDSKDYSLPISVTLPSSGFSSSETLTEETYLTSFTFTQDNRSLYFVADEAIPLDKIALTVYNAQTEDVTWEIVSDCVMRLTVLDTVTFSEAWLNLEITWEESGIRNYSLRLVNTPRLVLCPVDWNGNDYALPESLWAYEGGFAPGQTLACVFGVMTGSEIALISAPSVRVGGANISIGQDGAVDGFPVYLLDCRSVGQAQLRVEEYTITISVELPEYAEVRFGGKTVGATIQDGKITFPVAAAGTYTITEVEAPAQMPKPSKPATKPETSQEPEETSFSDVSVARGTKRPWPMWLGRAFFRVPAVGSFLPTPSSPGA